MTACFCACHESPGIYRSEPCSCCGHYHSKGSNLPPRGAWYPDDESLAQETLGTTLAAGQAEAAKDELYREFLDRRRAAEQYQSDRDRWRNRAWAMHKQAGLQRQRVWNVLPLARQYDRLREQLGQAEERAGQAECALAGAQQIERHLRKAVESRQEEMVMRTVERDRARAWAQAWRAAAHDMRQALGLTDDRAELNLELANEHERALAEVQSGERLAVENARHWHDRATVLLGERVAAEEALAEARAALAEYREALQCVRDYLSLSIPDLFVKWPPFAVSGVGNLWVVLDRAIQSLPAAGLPAQEARHAE